MASYYKDGFFNDDDGGFVPNGVIKITDDLYRVLLDEQAKRKQIIADKNGNPILIDLQPFPYTSGSAQNG